MDRREAAQILRQIRLQRDEQQNAVARRAGVKASRMQNWEGGYCLPDIAEIRRWGEALGQRLVFDLVDIEAERVAAEQLLRAEGEAEAARSEGAGLARRIGEMDRAQRALLARIVAAAGEASPAILRSTLAALEAMTAAARESVDEEPGSARS